MEVWLDTCDSQVITHACRLGIIYGVTTNPSILAEAHEDLEKIINSILDIQDGPVAIQVTADNAPEMIKQAIALHTFSDRIVVKVPVVQQGLIAMKALVQEGVPIMGTAVFQPNQALLAALAGADYVAPYVSRMFDAGIDAYSALETMMTMYRNYGFKTKILAAALRTTDQLMTCGTMGIPAATLKSSLFSQVVADDEAAKACIKVFAEDWEARDHHAHSILAL